VPGWHVAARRGRRRGTHGRPRPWRRTGVGRVEPGMGQADRAWLPCGCLRRAGARAVHDRVRWHRVTCHGRRLPGRARRCGRARRGARRPLDGGFPRAGRGAGGARGSGAAARARAGRKLRRACLRRGAAEPGAGPDVAAHGSHAAGRTQHHDRHAVRGVVLRRQALTSDDPGSSGDIPGGGPAAVVAPSRGVRGGGPRRPARCDRAANGRGLRALRQYEPTMPSRATGHRYPRSACCVGRGEGPHAQLGGAGGAGRRRHFGRPRGSGPLPERSRSRW
jgi:hypothetical protein